MTTRFEPLQFCAVDLRDFAYSFVVAKVRKARLSGLSRQQVRSAFSAWYSPKSHASSRSQRHAPTMRKGQVRSHYVLLFRSLISISSLAVARLSRCCQCHSLLTAHWHWVEPRLSGCQPIRGVGPRLFGTLTVGLSPTCKMPVSPGWMSHHLLR